ncbi:hypothetical protein CO608_05765 [Lysobacteraceae bacterium NML08-0793]|nr:hypothetical protein CO608_05765 [Xanthomonadaceae bacterium NML08-0793]
MGFHQLIEKVTVAEQALEAHERGLAANLRQTRSSWRAAWTPGRVLVAGLATGFLVGHGKLIGKLGGSNVLQLTVGFANLITGGMQAAAEQFSQMQAATGFGATKPADTPAATAPDNAQGQSETLRQHHEKLRRDGLV